MISVLLIAVLGVPLLIIVGGGLYLLIDLIRPQKRHAPVLTTEDEADATKRDLARLDAKRAERARRKPR